MNCILMNQDVPGVDVLWEDPRYGTVQACGTQCPNNTPTTFPLASKPQLYKYIIITTKDGATINMSYNTSQATGVHGSQSGFSWTGFYNGNFYNFYGSLSIGNSYTLTLTNKYVMIVRSDTKKAQAGSTAIYVTGIYGVR